MTFRQRILVRRGVALAALAVVVGGAWFLLALLQPGHGGGTGSVSVRIPPGAGAGEIGDILSRRGVVSSGFLFSLRARLDGERGDLKAGTFRLRHDMSYAAALSVLTRNPPGPPTIRVTIPEGRSIRETAPLVAAAGVRGSYRRAAAASALLDPVRYGAPRGTRTLEGFLFPATYQLVAGSPARALVARQVAAWRAAMAQVDLRHARRRRLTPYDVVVIASMVEREVARASERPLVAAVIYNRLHDHIPLAIDATLRYALGDWTRPLTRRELSLRIPYNTRIHPGLPPTPIGSPGLASLRAAAHPARVPYLYYVVRPGTCNRHAFSSDYARFQRDVARYEAARARLGGRSPTTCRAG